MTLSRVLFAALGLMSSHVSASSATAQRSPRAGTDTISRNERERITNDIRELVQKRFAHFAGIPGFSLPTEFARYQQHALQTSSRWDFSVVTRAFIASLKNGHTTFGDNWMRDQDAASWPFTVSYIENAWTVTGSRTPGLRVGDVIVTINGSLADSAYQVQAQYISASNDRARRREFMTRGFLWPREVMLGLSDGRTFTVARSIAPRDTSPPMAVVRDRWIDSGRIGYIAISSFGNNAYQDTALARITGTYQNAASLIVDVRNNGGGNTPRELSKTLLHGKEYVWWKEEPNLVPGSVFDRFGAMMRRRGGANTTFAGNVIVLINGGCASACEDFVMPLQWQKSGLIIGDTTMGTTGQPMFLRYDNGFQISVSARRSHFPDGRAFEGVGIAPDITVPIRRQDLMSGTDQALRLAIDEARKMRGR